MKGKPLYSSRRCRFKHEAMKSISKYATRSCAANHLRENTIKRLVTLLTVGMLGACSAAIAANETLRDPQDKPLRKAQDRPNIIFIMADDLGWQDVGYMGAKLFETPNIDQLAAEGMTFSRAYSSGPNCAPTRACLMSGLYTPRHNIYTPGGRSKGNPKYMRLLVPAKERKNKALAKRASKQVRSINGLNSSFVCIPEVLKESGYTSARFGKWHLGTDTQGFDISSSDGLSGERQHAKSRYGDIDVAENLTNRSLKFIEENRDKPFFLYLCHWDVHIPLEARKDVVKKYRDKLDAMPPAELAELKQRIPGYEEEYVPVYAAMVEAVDTSVKRVVAKVKELGIEKNTIIIFTSDNGGASIAQLAPLRGMKGSLFEAGVRIPACASWAGQITPGSTTDSPISSVDFLPTLAKLAGAPLPTTQPVDGIDISPLFFGKPIKERSIFWHYPLYLNGLGLEIKTPDGTYSWRGFPSTSLVRGKYKMVNFLEDQSFALYDLTKDPGEQYDIIDAMPELASQLKKELKAWQKKVNAPIPTTSNPECVLK